MMRLLALLSAGIAIGAAAPAAANENDFNVWGAQVIVFDLDQEGDTVLRLEAQERFTNDADRLGQLLLRSYLGFKIADNVTLGGGYGYILTDPVGPVEVNEHRTYQELTITLIDSDGVKVTSRSRLEQRFFEESDATGWRYRNQIQLRTPISETNTLVLYTEPFIGLNDVAFNRDGVSVWRNFVGVSVPLAERVTFTPGYLNQYVVRTGEDRMDHVVNLGLTARF